MFALALCFVQRFALVTSPKTWTVKHLHSVSLSERLEFWLNALSLPQAETTCVHLGGKRHLAVNFLQADFSCKVFKHDNV